MAYTKSQALTKNATPSTPMPSKKISKQGKRRASPAKSELPPKKPNKSARKGPSQKIYASKNRRDPPLKTLAYDKFSSTEAEEKFEKLKKRRLLIEKGFIPLDNNNPLPSYITDVVEKHGWESFCKPSISPIISLVKEFYANLVHEGEGFNSESIVRGQKLVITPEVINSVCRFESSSSDEYNDMLVTPHQEHFDQALRVAAYKGAEWSVFSTGARTIKFQMLTPEASVWLHFIKSRLIPTTHDTTVSANRMLLLYAILEGLSINVGRVILEEIVCCSRKKGGKLFFPSLITKLCIEAGVQQEPNEEILFERNTIDFHRLTQKHGGSDKPSTSKTTPSCHVPSNADIYAQNLVLQARLLDYWTYAEKRDIALRKLLQKNFTKPSSAFPAFPPQLLEPWPIPTADDADPTSSDEAEE